VFLPRSAAPQLLFKHLNFDLLLHPLHSSSDFSIIQYLHQIHTE